MAVEMVGNDGLGFGADMIPAACCCCCCHCWTCCCCSCSASAVGSACTLLDAEELVGGLVLC